MAAGTNFFSEVTSTLDVALTNAAQKAVFAKSQGTPPTTAGIFAIGCVCLDETNGIMYVNKGTVAVPVWNKIGSTPGLSVIQKTVTLAEFTDGGGAVGTLELDEDIPIGAVVAQTLIDDVTGFIGDVSCALTIGDGTDVDRYNTGTPSIFTTADAIDAGVVSGTAFHTAAKTPTLTATVNADWGSVTAGEMTITIFYFKA